MARTRKFTGGARRLSTRAKNTKKKLADINRAKNALLRKQKKLITANKRYLAGEAKLAQLTDKYEAVAEEVLRAESDLSNYQRELTYSDLQETR